jgi:cation transport regulator ChaC
VTVHPPDDPGATWVFGYGSLVAVESLADTIGRRLAREERHAAHLSGYGRRWNYGSLHLRGDWTHDGVDVRGGLVVSLGLTPAPDERCNGVVVRVTDAELTLLDRRERDYQRTDVTEHIALDTPEAAVGGRVVTYVPRPSAIERYEAARDAGRAAVRRTYWELVHGAFDELGGAHPDLWTSTPRPDVPVADVRVFRLDAG